MAELKHVSHGCVLTLPKNLQNGICNICYKDEPVELACDPCNFDLCKTCSNLPNKVSHHLHPQHSLQFRLRRNDEETRRYIICSGCGNMSSGSYYECKVCEIYLDLGCALMDNNFTSWDVKELLHDNHAHLVKKCRPGPDATGSCLLCELPLSPSSICYGCVHCYVFFHEHCLQLPTQIQHPLHPQHPLKRFDYIQSCGDGRHCNACGGIIYSVPFGCLECGFKLHMRCADTLLRGLMSPLHDQHRLFYAAYMYGTYLLGNKTSSCPICNTYCREPFFYCLECDLRFHLKCLEIPKTVFNKSYHIHPLVCQKFLPEEDSLDEYCGVCELVVHAKHDVYSCEKCDFLGHMECILRKGATPSPLYLKDLYSCGKAIKPPQHGDDRKTIKLDNKLTVNGVGHTHVLRSVALSELDERADCKICNREIHDNARKCEVCKFKTHSFCAELGLPRRHRFHSNHPLTLLPGSPVAGVTMNCDMCKKKISGFNLFCRLCGFIIHANCVLRDNQFLGTLHRGQKLIVRTKEESCLKNHKVFQVIVSSSYTTACTICEEKLCGKAVSCVECREIYHPWCTEAMRRGGKLRGHPLHSDHKLRFLDVSGSKCIVCKHNITKYGYSCRKCEISIHYKCVKAFGISETIKYHSHYLYNFREEDSTREGVVCSVCCRRCGVSFYGCIGCKFSGHVECVGFPNNVKNQRHQHLVELTYASGDKSCSLCGSECRGRIYSCRRRCKEEFHLQCIMNTSTVVTSEEDQLIDIYLMYIEQDLLEMYPSWW
ncbi:unnamed protein product [Cochlearia groenlandica]